MPRYILELGTSRVLVTSLSVFLLVCTGTAPETELQSLQVYL